MGRTIAHHFFHPKESDSNKKNKSSPFYFDKIPIKIDKIYRTINVELEHECKSLINSQAGLLPQIIVLDRFLDEFKCYITNNKRYVSFKYDINYDKDCPNLKTLIKSHKNFMHYLHIPKKDNGIWFCEGRFFTFEELDNRDDKKMPKDIQEFLKKKNIDYNDFFEEWVGLVFHLAAEYLLFKKKLKTIFFSCNRCHRPGVFIQGKLEKKEDPNKIFGTINVVDTIIYNCINNLNLTDSNPEEEERSKNNIILYDESYILAEYENIKQETKGAFIVVTNEEELEILIKEIKSKGKKYKFDLILKGNVAEKIVKIIDDQKVNNFFDRTCIYKLPSENNINIDVSGPNGKKPEIYNESDGIKKFLKSKRQDSEIYPTFNLLTYKEYINKYMVLHRLISNHYGQNENNSFKAEISYLKDFLLWNPELKAKSSDDKCKIETLLESLHNFKKIKGNEKTIINLYTLEKGSYYQDFNNWLNNLDPLAIQKTSWFIAAVIYCLNEYSKTNNKGIVEDGLKLYRGVKTNFSDLLNYKRLKGELICYPSFISSSKLPQKAKKFAITSKNSQMFETIITINCIYKEGFLPTAVDISEISHFPEEQECLFLPYSFFRIKNIEINYETKKAEIELDSIGKKEIFETKLKDGFKLDYNEGGFMEVVTEKQG